jgi:uncharacterized protein YjbI with pentapeptide repeats
MLAHLANLNLSTCDLSGSIFREADFSGTDLTGANLRDCDLEKCEWHGAKLADADLRGAKIGGLNLLTLATMKGLKVSQDQQWLLLAALGIEVHPN